MYELISVYSEPVAMSQRALSSRLSVSHLSHTQHNQICLFIVEITAFLLPIRRYWWYKGVRPSQARYKWCYHGNAGTISLLL